MSYKFKGVLSFPVLTDQALKNKQVRDADAKYGAMLLFAPNDPQVAELQKIVNEQKQNGFPNGFPPTGTVCFDSYDNKFQGKDYYDPRFKGWFALSMSSPTGKPDVVDHNIQPIMDPGSIYAGAVVWVNCGITPFKKGKGGVGGWLNGVMVTQEEPPMGRLDGKPSVEQMFGDVAAPSTQSFM